ncbi:hypothetical protein B0H13DRAFT_1661392, partial [Mycena leptocephala]
PPSYLFLCPASELQPGNSARVRVPDCPFFWSLDPSGVPRLSADEAKNLGLPDIDVGIFVSGFSWGASVYEGLCHFHRGKGFDPSNQDVARHLGFHCIMSPSRCIAHLHTVRCKLLEFVNWA